MNEKKTSSLLLGLSLALVAPMAHAASVVVVPGVGFSDSTAVSPVGGNPGTTVGAQRLNAFQFAADVWGARLASKVPIRVAAAFSALSCNANSGVLGSAGPTNGYRDFTGAPVSGTWFSSAEANALAGVDLDTASDDISANFNANIGTSGCLSALSWYYGFDGNAPANTLDFVTVLIHELGHGLGFLTFVDLLTGKKALGFNDVYMLKLENHGASPSDYPSMTDAQRIAASISGTNLHWTGTNVRAASPLLSAGRTGDHVQMYAPNPAQTGSSVSHWNTAATPNQIMEPSYTVPLHSPTLELPLFRDIGWKTLPPRGDVSGEGHADILWRNPSSGQTVVSLMSGAAITSTPFVGIVGAPWNIDGVGDFDFDGKSDLLWRNSNSGAIVIGLMNGASIISMTNVGTLTTDWAVIGTGDVNGDGKADILWRNTTTGATVVSYMNGAAISSTVYLGTVAPPWTVAGVGDVDANGGVDIIWHNPTTGVIVVSLLNGVAITSTTYAGTLPTIWSSAGVGDFNADGKADILWRNGATSDYVVSYFNGASITSTNYLGTLAAPWSVVELGDVNSDGRTDIFWRNSTSGDTVVSLVGDNVLTSTSFVGSLPAGVWDVRSFPKAGG